MQPGTDEEATGGGGGGGGAGGLGGSGNAGAAAAAAAFFPRGMRVLVVDDDPLCLMILERMLRRCNYQAPFFPPPSPPLPPPLPPSRPHSGILTHSWGIHLPPLSPPQHLPPPLPMKQSIHPCCHLVDRRSLLFSLSLSGPPLPLHPHPPCTLPMPCPHSILILPTLSPHSPPPHSLRPPVTTCNKATTALALLREGREAYDLVISDVYMPDMDGFKLLERIGLEMDLPVIMMSANGETSVVMKGITHGAVDYLLKPVRIEELRNIWQHVGEEHSGSVEEEELRRMRDGTHDPASSSRGGGGLGEWESTHPDAETGAGGGAGGGGGGAGQGASVPRSPSRNEGARLGKRSVEDAFGEERGEYGGGRGERGGLGGGEGMKGGEENAAGEADFRAAANATAAAAAAAAAAAGLGLVEGEGGGDGGGGGMLSAGMGYMGRLPYVVEEGESDMVGGLKKARIIWSVELHQQFVKAVHHLGVDKAVPKKILEMMGVPGLTRENVASHLQKFRLYLKRLSGMAESGISAAPSAALSSTPAPISSAPPTAAAAVGSGSSGGAPGTPVLKTYSSPAASFLAQPINRLAIQSVDQPPVHALCSSACSSSPVYGMAWQHLTSVATAAGVEPTTLLRFLQLQASVLSTHASC
ncbi:unnamed protein product [Closterium sp. NIES-65]|nr:unnamed protein product [Closterium sp. NIES-65]